MKHEILLDRPARDPLALLDELERVLGLHACPINWPLGDGQEFRGVYDRRAKQVHFFERVAGGAFRAPVSALGLADPVVREAMAPDVYTPVVEETMLPSGARLATDVAGQTVILFLEEWACNFFTERNPNVALAALPARQEVPGT
ncbi:MAG: hypothetical protein HY674_15895 [Chloroflexi bacterium]|nr:hypothetical protein [Chloroflexota bacterium]